MRKEQNRKEAKRREGNLHRIIMNNIASYLLVISCLIDLNLTQRNSLHFVLSYLILSCIISHHVFFYSTLYCRLYEMSEDGPGKLSSRKVELTSNDIFGKTKY